MKKQNIIETIRNAEEYEELNEATTTSGSRGSYKPPIRPGFRKWFKGDTKPFTDAVSNYIDAEVNYDSLDGHIDMPKEKMSKKQKLSKKISDKDYVIDAPAEGDDEYAPAPFKMVNPEAESLNEDLAVWFGTKKKPKGSKQPKGPWVNICKKVDGKHPPCGRPEASDKAYPKCRAAGVAGKMSDAQKQAACQQKRRAEKTNPKTGTGNKPKMVSYKPRKKTNESTIIDLIRKAIN
jgi:hypothetical protein